MVVIGYYAVAIRKVRMLVPGIPPVSGYEDLKV